MCRIAKVSTYKSSKLLKHYIVRHRECFFFFFFDDDGDDDDGNVEVIQKPKLVYLWRKRLIN